MSIPPQADFFYKEAWTPELDGVIVECLIGLKDVAHWSKSVFPSWFIFMAAEQIKYEAGVMFSVAELKDRVEVLRKRYKTFKAVLRIRGAYWDPTTKVVSAPEESWKQIQKVLYHIC